MANQKEWKDIIMGNERKVFKTIEMHTCGEPLRIITGGLPELEGSNILEKRKFFADHYDPLRKALMFEPRGHADMYGAVLTKAHSDDADFGVFFMHNEGYSTMCGHAIIALTKYVIETGYIKKDGNKPVLNIEVPAGKISSIARIRNGRVQDVSFRNVPSFLLIQDETIEVKGIGRIRFDLAYGGAFYVVVDGDDLGLNLDESDHNKLIDWGMRIKMSVIENFRIEHPFEQEMSFLYGTIFTGKAYDPDNWSRNVCIFAGGEVDRSPTGTGLSARAALHFSKSEMRLNQRVTIESIIGTSMDLEIKDVVEYGPYKAVIPEISGKAFFTGKNELWIDPDDPLREGFILR